VSGQLHGPASFTFWEIVPSVHWIGGCEIRKGKDRKEEKENEGLEKENRKE
jgi:hypothetical protein